MRAANLSSPIRDDVPRVAGPAPRRARRNGTQHARRCGDGVLEGHGPHTIGPRGSNDHGSFVLSDRW